MNIFMASFSGIFMAVLKIALVALFAGLLVRRNIISQEQINSLSAFTVKILLPCLIFSVTFDKFNPSEFTLWWLLVLGGMIVMLIGLGLGALLFWSNRPHDHDLIPLTSMQNGVFLILPIGQLIFSEQAGLFALYCFLFSLGQGVLIWSLGKYLLTGKRGSLDWHDFVSPPLVANVLAIGMVLLDFNRWVPPLIMDSVAFLSQATIPVATFVLGATLGSICLRTWPSWRAAVKVMIVKFIGLPVITIGFLLLLDWPEHHRMLGDLLVIESASAPATALILIVRTYGGDYQKIASLMLISYGLCMLAIPFWLAVWRVI